LVEGQGSSTGVSPEDRVLISDEWIGGRRCTKWPGGGLEFGEGPRDCAPREALEELGQAIELGPLVHATGGCVRSQWKPEEQVLCYYYLAHLQGPAAFRMATEPFDFEGDAVQSFRWEKAGDLNPEAFSFGTDREAWQVLTAGWSGL